MYRDEVGRVILDDVYNMQRYRSALWDFNFLDNELPLHPALHEPTLIRERYYHVLAAVEHDPIPISLTEPPVLLTRKVLGTQLFNAAFFPLPGCRDYLRARDHEPHHARRACSAHHGPHGQAAQASRQRRACPDRVRGRRPAHGRRRRLPRVLRQTHRWGAGRLPDLDDAVHAMERPRQMALHGRACDSAAAESVYSGLQTTPLRTASRHVTPGSSGVIWSSSGVSV
ncbi:hypothetical protein V8D89_013016 [Ganoderma adspersum]